MKYWIRCLRCLHDSGRMRYAEFGKKQIQCIVLVLISSIATIMFPNLVSKIIDEGIGSGELTSIYKYSIFLGITGAIMIISEYAYQMSFYKFSQKFILEIKELFFSKLLKTNIAFWSKHTVGDMFKILEDDIAAIENMFTRSISSIISNVFILIGVTSYLIHMHRKIGFFLIIFTVIIVWIQKRYGKKLENFAYPFREEVAMFSSYTNEVLNNIINVEMCGIKEKVNENYCEKNKKIVKKTLQQLKLITILKSIISSYSICSLFVIMMIGAGEVLANKMSVGDLVSLTMYIQWLLGPDREQLRVIDKIYKEYRFAERDIEITLLENHIFKKTKCSGGVDGIHISPDGGIFPCIYVVGNPHYKIGTIYEGINESILKNILQVNELPLLECVGCNNYESCNSVRCRYLNEQLTGDCMKPSPVICAFENENIKFISG